MPKSPDNRGYIPRHDDNEPMSRRNVLLALAGGAATLGGLEAASFFTGNGDKPYRFDLEDEIATRKGGVRDLYLTSSANFNSGSAQEADYTLLKAAIDAGQNSPQGRMLALETLVSQEKLIKNQEFGQPIVAKAFAYILSKNIPAREQAIQTLLKKVPYARDIEFITLNANPENGTPATVKSLPQLAQDGYTVDIPKREVVMQPDMELGKRLATFIQSLPPSQQAGHARQ